MLEGLYSDEEMDVINHSSWQGVEIPEEHIEAFKKASKGLTDPYMKAMVMMAGHWAQDMQAKIADGCTVKDCAEGLINKASELIGGATGYQVHMAKQILQLYWKHGEALKQCDI